MNPYPCTECNELHWHILIAWIERKYDELRKLYVKQADHKLICPVINSTWYLDLWPTAMIAAPETPRASQALLADGSTASTPGIDAPANELYLKERETE